MNRTRTWPHYDEAQIAAVVATLRSGRVNAWTGPDVTAFERDFAAHVGTRHAIAMANGTLTMDAALRALRLQPGDEVVVSPRSFIASASCVLLAGAVPVFADVDRDSQNITAESIARVLTPRSRGIIPVHLAGWPCDMEGIMALARDHDLWVIEDCAQAHGARIAGRVVGGFGTIGSYSFCQDKIISTGGEGGMIVTDDDELYETIWSFKDHGKARALLGKGHSGAFRWVHAAGPGTNLRMTGPSAVLGRAQLQQLPQFLTTRTANAQHLVARLTEAPIWRIPMPPDGYTHAFYRLYAFVEPDRLAPGWSRDRILEEATATALPVFSGSCPEIYLEQTFADPRHRPADRLPVARELGETSLAFLVDPTWDVAQLDALADALLEIVANALR